MLVVVDRWMTKVRLSLHPFVTGHAVTKGLAGDSGRRRQEDRVNTTINQKRNAQQRCQQQRQSNRQQSAGKMKGQEVGAT